MPREALHPWWRWRVLAEASANSSASITAAEMHLPLAQHFRIIAGLPLARQDDGCRLFLAEDPVGWRRRVAILVGFKWRADSSWRPGFEGLYSLFSCWHSWLVVFGSDP